jgi:hypothetical protein
MSKKAVSVTLEETNLVWLKSRTLARKGRSVSETLDELISRARMGGPLASEIKSVAGTVDLPIDDPDLEYASAYAGGLIDDSLRRPFFVKEAPATPYDGGAKRSRKSRRG